MSLEWLIARRYLSSSDRRRLSLIPLIATAGITVGVIALIVVTSVMNGLQADLRVKILGASPHLAITSHDEAAWIADWKSVLPRVRQVGGVVATAPFTQSDVVIANRANYAVGAILRGVESSGPEEGVTEIDRKIRSGELPFRPTRSGIPPILIGSTLAEQLGVVPGDLVTLVSVSGKGIASGGGFQPRSQQFEMTAAFETGVYAFDLAHLYTTLAAGQELAGMGTSVSGLGIRTADPMRADRVAKEIGSTLGAGYSAKDWKTANSSLFAALQMESLAMSLILLLIVLVASFGIMSLLVMLVNEKRREIGILRSMGLRAGQVRRVFVLQGAVIGVVGSVLGGTVGLLLSWMLNRFLVFDGTRNAFALDRIPVAFDRMDIGLIIAASMAISFVATLYPASQAANLLPVDAIRGE